MYLRHTYNYTRLLETHKPTCFLDTDSKRKKTDILAQTCLLCKKSNFFFDSRI